MATNNADVQRIVDFLCPHYQRLFPGIIPGENGEYMAHSFHFFAEDDNGNIISTFSLVIDNIEGFPEETLFAEHIENARNKGELLVQMGRFVIDEDNADNPAALAMENFRVLYLLPRMLGFDTVLGMVRQKDLELHKNFGAQVFSANTGVTYGSKYYFATICWQLDKMSRSFFKYTRCQPVEKPLKAIYQQQQWDEYALAFAGVQTSFQRELQMEVINYLSGNVGDFGSGPGKLGILMSDNPAVERYVGIDYSPQMVSLGNHNLAHFGRETFTLWQGKIEDYQGETFDCGVSTNSYYTWPDPIKVLVHIYSLLKPEGIFILATPNPRIDMRAMEKQACKEL
ncbi:MAG: class I SAM-dependent methyltransferase, partial [Psychrosphaera sp.]|nr:class I SAM-dependent methyltransferase [Psychrosphaera sp.]